MSEKEQLTYIQQRQDNHLLVEVVKIKQGNHTA
jgi:hypothetical protein